MLEGTPVGKVGNVTRDPEFRFTPSGTPIVKFGLAVTPYVARGEAKPEAVFYEVTAFGSIAENVVESVAKGQRVVVVGSGTVTEFNGKERKEIVAEGIGPDLRFATTVTSRSDAKAAQPQQLDDTQPF